jgi:hypothetical protein
VHRVVSAHAAPHGIGEDPAEQSHRARCRSPASGHTCEPALFCRLRVAGRFALGNIVQEALDIVAGDGDNFKFAQQRLDVALDAALVDRQRACLLRALAARQQPPGLGIGKICVAQLGDCGSLAPGALLGRRIGALYNLAEDAPGLLPRRLGRPRRTRSLASA